MSAGGQIDWDSVAPRANAGASTGGINWDTVAPKANPTPTATQANPEAQHVQAHPLKGQNFGDWLSEELLAPVVNAATQLGRGIQGLGHPEQRPLTESVKDVVQGGSQIAMPFAYGLNGEPAPAEPAPAAGVPSAVGTALKGAATGAVKAIPKAAETSILKYTGIPQITRGAITGAKEALKARAEAITPPPPAVDPLLDKIAQGFGVKDFSSLGPEQQATVRELGARMTGGQAAAPVTPPPYTPRPPEYYGVKATETPPAAAEAPPQPAPAAAAPPVTSVQPNGGPLRPPMATPAPPAAPPATEPVQPEPAAAPAATPEPAAPKPRAATGATAAKSQRYADAIAAWAKDMGMTPKGIADQWETASPEVKGQIYLQLKSKGYLGANETIPKTSAQGVVDALKAKAATIRPPAGFSLGSMGASR